MWRRLMLTKGYRPLTDLEIDFDVAVTGFDLPEIDLLIGELSVKPDGQDPADAIVAVAQGPAISRPGDIWQIGSHRLICGDSTQQQTYQQLLGCARAQVIFTDPPYNVPIAGHVGGLGSIQHREFAMASGEDVDGRIHSIFAVCIRSPSSLLGRRRDPFSMHGLAPCPGDLGGRDGRVCGSQKHLRLGQKQWRHGFALPVPARVSVRFQIGYRAACGRRSRISGSASVRNTVFATSSGEIPFCGSEAASIPI
jgi:hypothetical protein